MRHLILTIVCLTGFAPLLLADDWPQWRGPLSNGVSPVSGAPERWSDREKVRWRAEIEGYGISSPVIVRNRVYVTTAITSERRSALRLACDFLIGCLAGLGLPAFLRYGLKRRMRAATGGRSRISCRVIHALDIAVFVLLVIVVFGSGALMAIGPNGMDAGLKGARDVGVEFARSLGRHHTNLWFMEWDEGIRHNTWIISSAMALASLGLLPFFFPRRSSVRLVGSVALFIGVAVATVSIPWPAAYGDRSPTGILVVLYSPVLALAAWHLFAAASCSLGVAGDMRSVASGTRLLSTVPALLSLALFVSPNYLDQRETSVTRRLVCLDAASGKTVWHSDAFTTPPQVKSSMNSHATPTPIVVGDTIVAAFGPGIAAFDLNGLLLWSTTAPEWIAGSIYGPGSSPVTDGSVVLVTNDREYEAQHQSQVVAYSLETGDELWSQSPPFAHDGYATPVIYDDGSRKLLLALTSGTLVGYAVSDGAIAWRLKVPVSTPIPSLVVEDDRLYMTGGGAGGSYTAAYQLQLGAAPVQLWSRRQHSADVSSPVLYKGRLFTISSTGIMVSSDAQSGEIIWRQRVGSGLGVFYSSLFAADDKIYAVRSNGKTYVISAEDTFRLISESSLPEEIFASPAFGADCLFLRTVSALYCIGDTN